MWGAIRIATATAFVRNALLLLTAPLKVSRDGTSVNHLFTPGGPTLPRAPGGPGVYNHA